MKLGLENLSLICTVRCQVEMLFDYIKIAIEIIGCMWITSLYFWINGNLLASGRCGTVFKPDFQTYCILIYWTVPMELLSIKWATYQIRQLRIVRAPGMPRTFSLPPTSKETASKRSAILCIWQEALANGPHLWSMYIGSGNRSVPSVNKLVPETVLIEIYVTIWHH